MNFVTRALIKALGGEVRGSKPARFPVSPISSAVHPAILAPGVGTQEGDYLAAMTPDPVDPRSQRGSLIRVMSSWGVQVAWQYVCAACGTNNRIDVSRPATAYQWACIGGCGRKFVIDKIIEAQAVSVRDMRNRRDGTDLSLDVKEKPLTLEEYEQAVAEFPEHKPGLATSPEEAAKKNLRQQLGPEFDGTVDYDGDMPHSDSLADNIEAFADPSTRSAARHPEVRTRPLCGSRK